MVRERLWPLIALAAFATTAAAEDPYGIAWIRQLGTSGVDESHAVALDNAGNVYITGHTDGSLGGPSAGDDDAFLAKYDPGGELIWIRQFGTSARDGGSSVAVDSDGNAYTSGLTRGSLGGPIVGVWDAFLAKHDPSGEMLWIRQLGSATNMAGVPVAVDSAGNAYIGGATYDSLGGPSAGGIDAFLAKYDPSGELLWIRQLGTSSSDRCSGLAVDSAGNVYMSGSTFGSLGGPKTSLPSDAFLAKYDASGELLWVRQLGTRTPDFGHAVAVDTAGNAYLTGTTEGTLVAPVPVPGGMDVFLAKYDPSGEQLWVRQFGTPSFDDGRAVAVDRAGNAYLSGRTEGSFGGPSIGGGRDTFLVKYTPTGELLWARQLGTPEWDRSLAVAVDSAGNAYSTGYTYGSLGGPSAGDADAFLARYSACPADCDGDGELTLADFLCFQSMFSGGGLGADCDGDGALTFFDFLCYQNGFAAGCD